MKKTYITPDVVTVRLMPQAILAGSPLKFSEDGETVSGTLNDEDADSEGLVKGSRNVWSEDW